MPLLNPEDTSTVAKAEATKKKLMMGIGVLIATFLLYFFLIRPML